MMEMLARVKAVLRRTRSVEPPKIVSAGPITMNLTERTVSVQESSRGKSAARDVVLTMKEFELLRKFLCHPRRVYTRDELLSSIWGEDFVGDERTVNVHLSTLRMKLGDAGDMITTVRGIGYKLAT